ncbi:MAG: amidohydrolase family protein [Paludisphaera borealis]|uniref:amidohydrolase family protein n=1 Tax=Paludisphaera borealis TaxID=1387353 RepID=UPI00284ED5EB|nr:amidohydrolase family protein [Paludisphaera borealis]MDR3619622.1 amidohydrolase family protein [Paludisphaera borealis]
MMLKTLAFLSALLTVVLALVVPASAAGPPHDRVKEAVTKGLALVQKAASNYPTHRDCFACHHQTLPMLATVKAHDAGVSADETLLQAQAEFTLESFVEKRSAMKAGKGVGGGAMTVGYGLWTLDIGGLEADETTDAMTSFLLKTQGKDGRWTTGGRPPMEESAVTCTVISAYGLKTFARGPDKAPADAAVASALRWIENAPRSVQEDYSSQLWGLTLLGAGPDAIARARESVLARQNEDGGWSSADKLPSDAYASGQALVRLSESGVSPGSPAFERGVRYLLESQQPDGSWRMETRAKPVQEYFDNGDPHGKHQFISTPATCWAVAALAVAIRPEAEEAGAGPVDVLIRGGTIVDGSGNPAYQGDVAVRGDRIEAVGRIPAGTPARRVINAAGLVVAPGFIDMHSHSDMTLFEDGAGTSKVSQGVTTEVLGEDSSGGPSLGKLHPKRVKFGDKTFEWTTLGGYFDALERSKIAPNVASYVGLGTLLGCVTGDALDRPTAAHLEELKTLLDDAMSEGAFGLSTMLAGPRELKVTTDDLVALVDVVRRHGGIFSSHMRNEGTDVFAAIDEAITIGERGDVPVDILHLKIADQAFWGKMDQVVARIEDARRRGVNVQANIYPYTRGNNDLVTIIPPWAHEGGKTALLARLKDPSQRDRLKAEIRDGLPGWYDHYKAVGGDWSRMLVSARLTPKNAAFEGKTMDVILAARAKSSPDQAKADLLDLFLDFLIEEGGSVSTIYAHHTEEDMNLALRQPWCSIGSDGLALAVEGSLRRGHPHPRSFGTFPRVLGVYVRERRLLTVEDAVRKMSSLNAAKLGIQDRGLLRAGMFADVTVFDPKTVVDKSTYLEPFHYSEGIVHVLVNGRPVFENGKATGDRPGRVIRHKG